MSATASGTKTVTKSPSGRLTAAALTAILATPVELLTVKQLNDLIETLRSQPGGDDPARTIASLLN
jgi:hypothetical protein